MKKALAIAGILALSITPTASFGSLNAEAFAGMYESGPNWTSWTECYVNNYADLRLALPGWVGAPIFNHSNTLTSYPDPYVPSNLDQAGRFHYVLYGYDERREPTVLLEIKK